MCVVSMVMDEGNRIWPGHKLIPYPIPASIPLTNPEKEELEALRAWKKMVDLAKEVDKKTNQPDCEDPEKIKTLGRLEKRIKDLEKRLKNLEKD